MTSERECYVYIVLPGTTEFVTAGRFRVSETRAGEPVGEFVYGRSYLARPDAVGLDPIELRLAPRLYKTARIGGFFGTIRDAMPDYWGRRVIEKHSSRAILDEFDYLLEGPDDRAGALGFGLNVVPPNPRRRFNQTLHLERLQAAADAVMNNDPDLAGTEAALAQDLIDPGTSMGGARPKTVVQDKDDLWIAKFGQQDDRWNYPLVEQGVLSLAKLCGLAVADSRVDTVAGRDVLLVRRFDRDAVPSGYRRHRMVSALTLLQAGDAPSERTRWSYLLLADELRRVSASPEADLRELFKRICFNAAVSNLDDHPRNHAVIAKDTSWRLSPAFDLTPSPVIAMDHRDLAMVCGDFRRYANQANILSRHGRFLLSEEDALQIFKDIIQTVKVQWRQTMRRVGVNETDCEAIKSAFLYAGLFFKKV